MPSAYTGRPPAADTAAARRHLLDLLGPVIASAGYDLDDVTVSAAGRRTLVRVNVDADGGIDLDAVAEVSRIVSSALDADAGADTDGGGGPFAGPYVLEVSSPGVDRPLTQHRHWVRATGRLVEVAVDGKQTVGRVLAVDGAALALEVDGVRREFPWTSLGPGRVQVEFNRPGSADVAGE